MSDEIKKLIEIIKESDNIVFLGGAGVSTESGIPDFRSGNGLYGKGDYGVSPETILSHTFFINNTEKFYDYYKKNMLYPFAQPNFAHKGLKILEDAGKLKCVITQNIDGLHQKAGSKNVVELHGSVLRNYCVGCGKFFGIDHIMNSASVPTCDSCGRTVKPDVVLYEEGLSDKAISDSLYYISNADTLIVGGTSLTVNPAASLIYYFKGKNLVIINKTPTPYDKMADLIIREPIGETLKTVTENLD